MSLIYKINEFSCGTAPISRALGLDLGNQLGYAYLDFDEQNVQQLGFPDLSQTCGMLRLKEKPEELWGLRFVRFKQFLNLVKPTVIFYELVRQRFKSNKAAINYGGMVATALTWAAENNVQYCPLEVNAIKKFATGKGFSDKTSMIDSANLRFATQLDPKKEKQHSDIADALHILSMGMKTRYSVDIFPHLQPIGVSTSAGTSTKRRGKSKAFRKSKSRASKSR